ncbi:hypothetical protein MKY25_04595 [Geobacillus sp. FSL W8-0032]|uniref:Uncharacterized protein n=1 Tax=Geobacillus icigianus TaxID=1430331 RepID=A0ABU6BEN7_9BACL|nr:MULTISPECIES: hypothetical protein [Geobacillus]KYD26797.1 hypothetical protein B4113_0673 [Geobacillus sp. B4113_201601]MEB3750169.1 hypothetical protein [Geobacillus icigianus]
MRRGFSIGETDLTSGLLPSITGLLEHGGIFMLFHEYVLKNEKKADKVINVSGLNIYLYLSIFM